MRRNYARGNKANRQDFNSKGARKINNRNTKPNHLVLDAPLLN